MHGKKGKREGQARRKPKEPETTAAMIQVLVACAHEPAHGKTEDDQEGGGASGGEREGRRYWSL